jgi:hypothetical protein
MQRAFNRSNLLLPIFVIAILAFMVSCSSGSKSTPEATLAVTTNPAVNTVQAPAVGPDFSLNVTITSAMPPKGVTITVSSARDGGGASFFSTTTSTTQTSNNFSITNTPIGYICVVTITVTSNSTSTNTWTGTYRYSYK